MLHFVTVLISRACFSPPELKLSFSPPNPNTRPPLSVGGLLTFITWWLFRCNDAIYSCGIYSNPRVRLLGNKDTIWCLLQWKKNPKTLLSLTCGSGGSEIEMWECIYGFIMGNGCWIFKGLISIRFKRQDRASFSSVQLFVLPISMQLFNYLHELQKMCHFFLACSNCLSASWSWANGCREEWQTQGGR